MLSGIHGFWEKKGEKIQLIPSLKLSKFAPENGGPLEKGDSELGNYSSFRGYASFRECITENIESTGKKGNVCLF